MVPVIGLLTKQAKSKDSRQYALPWAVRNDKMELMQISHLFDQMIRHFLKVVVIKFRKKEFYRADREQYFQIRLSFVEDEAGLFYCLIYTYFPVTFRDI